MSRHLIDREARSKAQDSLTPRAARRNLSPGPKCLGVIHPVHNSKGYLRLLQAPTNDLALT
jgi:hypothetical protein